MNFVLFITFQIVDGEESEVNHLKKALFLIKKFEDEVTFHSGCDTNLTSEAISSWVSLIREECANLVEMPVLMASIARPMLDNSLARWDPLKVGNVFLLSIFCSVLSMQNFYQ